ncbi:PREDICTED: protein DOG1-like 4 [Nicotiana attenuata]|uniref:Transcription factor tga5 n=1 Tax=Nicotiana attenuata TaxID=49451 RepID=A0A1J6KI73_NICAT|nr:PREDICTED: protein DOG1-like 4 [Nicotiana attenuata]OIT24592.1 transcription factor tga5 [Nicotiana attenuata]
MATAYLKSQRFISSGWLIQQEFFLQQLLRLTCESNDNCINEERLIIDQVLAHYCAYYVAKSKVTQENVFLVLSPTWFTPLERTYLWIAGFRPGLAFRLVNKNVLDLSRNQSLMLNELLEEIKVEEKQLTDEFTRVQQTMALETMILLLREEGLLENGRLTEPNRAIDRLRLAMETLVECADYLRGKTVLRIVDILSATQTVRFLAAATQLHLRIRSLALQSEAN